MDHRIRIAEVAHSLAAAISRRDVAAIRDVLAQDFSLRTPGKGAVGTEEFVAGIAGIPGEIVFVRLENLEIDVHGSTAIVTGVQRAQLRIDGNVVDDARPFVDYFVQSEPGRWKVRVALDLPALADATG